MSVPVVVCPQAGAGASQELTTQAHAPPVLEQEPPQLSVPVVVVPQAGSAALQEVTTQPHAPPVLEQEAPQLSVPVVVCPQAGSGALQPVQQLLSATHWLSVPHGCGAQVRVWCICVAAQPPAPQPALDQVGGQEQPGQSKPEGI